MSEFSKVRIRRQNPYFFFKLPMWCGPGLQRELLKFVLGQTVPLFLWDPKAGLSVMQMYLKYLFFIFGDPYADAVSSPGRHSV